MPFSLQKDPASSRRVGVDWRNILPAGANLSSVVWTVPAGLAKVAEGISGTIGWVQVSGGTLDQSYELEAAATFSSTSEIDVRRLIVTIREL